MSAIGTWLTPRACIVYAMTLPHQSAPASSVAAIVGRWSARRAFPLLATLVLIVIGMAGTTIIGPRLVRLNTWALPHDLWGTLVAARRLVGLHLAGLYTPPTGLITFPGAAVLLAPVGLVAKLAGLSLATPGADNPYPAVWLVAGPYSIAVSGIALVAADALAERLGSRRPQRLLLALVSAAAIWNVSVEWGHPEDAVAVGLLLFAFLGLADGRPARSAWLVGAAVAVQPLVLLALPMLLVIVEWRKWLGFLARASAPAVLLLAAALVANPATTWHAVTSQPNWPAVDHPTPWATLATQLGGHRADGAIAAGPARVLAVLAAVGCTLLAARRLRALAPDPARHRTAMLRDLLWWAAVCLALRSFTEPVMVAFYLWPPLAVALIAASRDWRRLIPASLFAVAVTFGSQSPWHSRWGWWGLTLIGLTLTLYYARPPRADSLDHAWTGREAPVAPPAQSGG